MELPPKKRTHRSRVEKLVSEIHISETLVERKVPSVDEVERWIALTLPCMSATCRRRWATRTTTLCKIALKAAPPLPPPAFGVRAALERWAKADLGGRRAVHEMLDLMRKSHERCGRSSAAAAFVYATSVLFGPEAVTNDGDCSFNFGPIGVGPVLYPSPDDARREARGLSDATRAKADQ